ncbi:MAG TPA: hypothetical protein VHB79_11015 [Polyangiaceae bacterium]|nr:hypothetical protein [Polyangiaceae bacterium]
MDTLARQRLLAAVGDAGQARIAKGRYAVGGASAFASSIEREYLTRAGAEQVAVASDPVAPFTHAAVFQHAAAREFAEGTWRALIQIKSALSASDSTARSSCEEQTP